MCNALRELMKDEIAQEIAQKVAQAESKTRLECIQETQLKSLMNVMKSFSVNSDKAMDILRIPAAEREIYRSKLP